jgi:hypothetical protein
VYEIKATESVIMSPLFWEEEIHMHVWTTNYKLYDLGDSAYALHVHIVASKIAIA